MPLPPIIYEDETLLALDRPAGMDLKAKELLAAMVRERAGREAQVVHRVDLEASGVMLWAKTKPARDFLSGQFQAKTVTEVARALVAVRPAAAETGGVTPGRTAGGGLPEAFVVELRLGPDEARPERVRVFHRRGGKECRTECRVVEDFGRFALVECRAGAAGWHQFRAHLAAAGLPVLNDALYVEPVAQLLLSELKRGYKGREEEQPLLRVLGLHVAELGVRHPQTREPMVLRAALPAVFELALKYLRKFPPRGRR